jgi:hypothetical protein
MRRLAFTAALALVAVSSQASAAVVIGQTAVDPGTDIQSGFFGNYFLAQTSTAAPPQYTVPAGGGVITSWSAVMHGENMMPRNYVYALHTLRKNLSGNYLSTGSDPAEFDTPGTIPPLLYTHAARLPVIEGDTIGMKMVGGPFAGPTVATLSTTDDADSVGQLPGEPTAGTPFSFSGTYTKTRLLISAVVEPDADHDNFGDESQDACPADASARLAPCPSAAPPAGKGPKLSVARGAVRLSKKGAISFIVTADEVAAGTASGTISLPKRAKVVRFKRSNISLAAGKLTKVTLKLSRKNAAKVRRALRRRSLKAKVTLAVKDAAGNATTRKLSLKLRR